MKIVRKRNCCHCKKLYRPNKYNHDRQSYCLKDECQKARSRKNRLNWKSREENRDYFKGPWNVDRVKEWRAKNFGYWKRSGGKKPLQTAAISEHTGNERDTKNALQTVDSTQLFLITGLISHITGDTLQAAVLKKANYFILKGQNLLNQKTQKEGDVPNAEKVSGFLSEAQFSNTV